MNKKGISVIISAYKSENFIEECLDSINNQSYFKDFNNYEILLGIDGCEETKNKTLEIRNKYKNLKVYWFEENSGPYLVFNTLINNSKYDIITIFGADDIMKINHIESNLNLLKNGVFVKSACGNFNNDNKNKILRIYNPCGLVFFYKKDFIDINGFENWRCGADTDLNNRFILNKLTNINNNKLTSLRRLHKNSLTNIREYGKNSEYRKKISLLINKRNITKINNFNLYINAKEI